MFGNPPASRKSSDPASQVIQSFSKLLIGTKTDNLCTDDLLYTLAFTLGWCNALSMHSLAALYCRSCANFSLTIHLIQLADAFSKYGKEEFKVMLDILGPDLMD